jgi:hypothetical protein
MRARGVVVGTLHSCTVIERCLLLVVVSRVVTQTPTHVRARQRIETNAAERFDAPLTGSSDASAILAAMRRHLDRRGVRHIGIVGRHALQHQRAAMRHAKSYGQTGLTHLERVDRCVVDHDVLRRRAAQTPRLVGIGRQSILARRRIVDRKRAIRLHVKEWRHCFRTICQVNSISCIVLFCLFF